MHEPCTRGQASSSVQGNVRYGSGADRVGRVSAR
jgi:hypothetical protein